MLDGIDPAKVTAWLADRVDEIRPPLDFSIIDGGKSNLTYVVTDANEGRWVLRRPPLHGVIPSAHDMEREHRINSKLRPTGVPVPRTVGYESDLGYIGSPFYVMEFVEGHVLRDPEVAVDALENEAQSRVGESMVEVLHTLHALKPYEVGLGDLGRNDDYVSRQLRAWGRQLEREDEANEDRLRLLRRVRGRLKRSVPDQQQNSIVHGDYRLDNVIISDCGTVNAVLDWELCTIGDPLADVATLAVYWSDADDSSFPIESATVAPGFSRRMDIVHSYMRDSDLDFSRFHYYLAFAFWRLAVILEGVLRRFDAGAYGEAAEASWDRLRQSVPKLGDMASESLLADTAFARH